MRYRVPFLPFSPSGRILTIHPRQTFIFDLPREQPTAKNFRLAVVRAYASHKRIS
jgi:hypothetical protein